MDATLVQLAGAVISGVAAVVTAVMAFMTWRMAKETKRVADGTATMAERTAKATEATKSMATETKRVAEETARYADSTEKILKENVKLVRATSQGVLLQAVPRVVVAVNNGCQYIPRGDGDVAQVSFWLRNVSSNEVVGLQVSLYAICENDESRANWVAIGRVPCGLMPVEEQNGHIEKFEFCEPDRENRKLRCFVMDVKYRDVLQDYQHHRRFELSLTDTPSLSRGRVLTPWLTMAKSELKREAPPAP